MMGFDFDLNENGDVNEASSTAGTSTTRGDATPTHTAVSDDPVDFKKDTYSEPGAPPMTAATTAPTTAEVVPWPGSTFVIRERSTGRAITLVDNELQMQDWDCAGDRSSHWVCEERQGWLGFRSPVTRTYIGHNNRRGFYAKADRHDDWEYICAMRHPEGGYILLVKRWSSLTKMNVAKDGHSLVETTGEGTVWEFVKL